MSNENDQRTKGFAKRVLYLPDRYADALFILLLLSFTVGTIYYEFAYD